VRTVLAEPLQAPVVTAVVAASADDDPITDGAQIRIRGENLAADTVQVLVDGSPIAVGTITNAEITATLPPLPAGVHGVKVRHMLRIGQPLADHAGGTSSNLFAFVLAPTITKTGSNYDITPSNPTSRVDQGVTYDSADLEIGIDPPVEWQQRVSFMLNQLGADPARAYTFTSESRDSTSPPSPKIKIRAVDVIPGQYLVRVQVDGAESRLVLTGDTYTDPAVTL
jgi:hypothetical protein